MILSSMSRSTSSSVIDKFGNFQVPTFKDQMEFAKYSMSKFPIVYAHFIQTLRKKYCLISVIPLHVLHVQTEGEIL
jgi:hypothetical protein